jgi:arylsulfatase A-like enzyme
MTEHTPDGHAPTEPESTEQPDFRGTIGDTVHESRPWWPEPTRPAADAPDVLVVVLDDVGFADLGCYGSEIPTPNIDRLAAGGLRYDSFHTTTLCSPSRACLLTGRNHHSVGMSMVAEWDTGYPNSRSRITDAAATLPQLLSDAGYATFAVGKWHLAPPHETTQAGPFRNWPLAKGFDRFYGFLAGYTDQFHPELIRDNSVVEAPARPEDGYHLSEDLADQAIAMLTDHLALTPERPVFTYLAFGACHWPLQVPEPYRSRHRGRYDRGWDEVRAERLARQRQLGVVPDHAGLPPRNDGVVPWYDLDEPDRTVAARLQEVYAGFLEHTDTQIGRVLDLLEAAGRLDDTVVVLLSDNGASQEGGTAGFLNFANLFNALPEDLTATATRIDEIGGPSVQPAYPIGWAQVSNTPLRRYKGNTHGGGIRDPLIVHWPAGITDPGAVRHQFHHVIDLMPTLLELAGVAVPANHRGVPQLPVHGTSMVASLRAAGAAPRTRQHFEMGGHRAMYLDGWKAVTYHPPYSSFDDDRWELYHVASDFSELHDLADERPDVLERLVGAWWEAAAEFGVLPLDDRIIERFTEVGPPGSVRTRDEFVFRSGATRVAPVGVPALSRRSFDLVAEIDRGEDGGDGILVAHGGVAGGFAWYVLDGRLVFTHHVAGDAVHVRADRDLPPGRSTVDLSVTPTSLRTATVRLGIDGDVVASARLERVLPVLPSTGGFQIGADTQSPAAPGYRAPFRFDGTIHTVRVLLGGDAAPLTITELLLAD